MPRARFGLVLLLLATAGAGGCDDPQLSSSTSPSQNSPNSPPARLNDLSGTWSGTASDEASQVQMVWTLTQTGTSVTGSVSAATNLGRPVYTGSIAGTVTSNVLTFTITVQRGGIVDLPECTLQLSGSTTDLQSSSMAGTYTGVHSCSGAVQGGRFVFIKQ